ncbi:hypothetical protein GCM10009085_53050 [Pseudomonas avellanae]|nr:hypothetical protein GCM10009085_53050 [Pseudomonas avellanae]
MGEKSFLPTSTPRWHHAEGAFLGGLPCIGIIEIPIHERATQGLADAGKPVDNDLYQYIQAVTTDRKTRLPYYVAAVYREKASGARFFP